MSTPATSDPRLSQVRALLESMNDDIAFHHDADALNRAHWLLEVAMRLVNEMLSGEVPR